VVLEVGGKIKGAGFLGDAGIEMHVTQAGKFGMWVACHGDDFDPEPVGGGQDA